MDNNESTSRLTTTLSVKHHIPQAMILVTILVFANVLYKIFFHPLRRIPGPFFAKFTVLWLTRRYYLGRWHDDILDLHRKYGSVVRIAPNEVSFVDKNALATVYGHASGGKKTSWYDVWSTPDLPASMGVFSNRVPKQHAFLRKRVAIAYSMSTILSIEPQIQAIADSVWAKFHAFAASDTAIDLSTWQNYFTFDVVGQLGMGGAIGFVEKGMDVNNIISAIHDLFFLPSFMGYVPGQSWWFTNLVSQKLTALLPGHMQGGVLFSTWLDRQVRGRMDEEDAGHPKERTTDMLDHFINMKDPDGAPARYKGVLMEGFNLIGAGADTTAIGMATVMGKLLSHPEDYDRVQREVDDAFVAHDLVSPADLTFTLAEKIPYLNACIKEATRLCPSILWQLPREAPADGITISGYYIPRSATVSMSPIAQNRCKEVFGDDADEWKPERWLEHDDGLAEQRKDMNRFNVTFGFGSRTCIGRNLAMVELHKFVGQFVRQFDCRFTNTKEPFSRRSQWFCVHENMMVELKERKV